MRIVTATPTPLDGGWALTDWPRSRQLVHLPSSAVDDEPAYTIADAWQPPHHMALSPDLCDRILTAARASEPSPSGNGTYYHDPILDAADRAEIVQRFTRANAMWWRLDVNRWAIGVKQYRVGERHMIHQDLHAGAACRKLAGVVQLSDPSDYDGGRLVMRFSEDQAVMPAARGTLVAFPGWTTHEVTPVTRGERWSLCVNAWGPPLR